MRRLFISFVLAAATAAACSSSNGDSPQGPTGAVDAGNHPGTPTPDDDSGTSTPDKDASVTDAGYDSGGMGMLLGSITAGDCAAIVNDLTTTTPSLDIDTIVFTAGETYDRNSLSPGGQTLYDTANAGGSSTESETMSYEVLRYCTGAVLLHTETEIAYAPPDDSGANTISDLEVQIGSLKVGVSVTRMYQPSSQGPITDDDARALITKKLEGVVRSSQRVLPQDKWVKQILHVFSVNQAATDAISRVWPTIDPAIRADTIVLVTQSAGGGFLYCHPTPPLGSECP